MANYKNLMITILFSIITIIGFSQGSERKYFIKFTDKNNSPYSLSNPQVFLSQRAINRRAIQNIALNNNDLPISPAYIDSLKQLGFNLYARSKWFNGMVVGTTDTNLISSLNSKSYIQNFNRINRYANPNGSEKLNLLPKPINKRVQQSNSITQISSLDYGMAYDQVHQIGCECMHDIGYKGQGKMITVLDAGFPGVDNVPAFDSLRNQGRLVSTFDEVTQGTNVFAHHSHGTMVLSTMAGNATGELIGTAPSATYAIVRTEDAPTEYIIEEYNWVAGAEYADSIGTDIINSSLGYTQFDNPSQDHQFSDMNGKNTPASCGATIAASKGILVVCSAGNGGGSSWNIISTPADADSILTVGAVNNMGQLANFSSIGPTADSRIKPEVVAMGFQATVADPSGSYQQVNGTSFSSPIMAGAMACLWQSNPYANVAQIIDAIKQSASLSTNPNNNYGYGIPNLCTAMLLLNKKDIIKIKEDWQIFPSPFTNEINIQFYSTDSGVGIFKLYELSGKKIFEQTYKPYLSGFNVLKLNAPTELAKGSYLLSYESEKIKKLIKLIKTN